MSKHYSIIYHFSFLHKLFVLIHSPLYTPHFAFALFHLFNSSPVAYFPSRDVFPGVPILLCIWHVRKAWSKNLISKVTCPFSRAQLNRELDEIMYARNTGWVFKSSVLYLYLFHPHLFTSSLLSPFTVCLLTIICLPCFPDPSADSLAFMNRWACKPETAAFAKYYQKEWHYKVIDWATQMRIYPHADQDTNGAIERYHGMFKQEMRKDKASVKGRKMIWLLGKTMAWENGLWSDSGKQWQGRIRNRSVETTVWNSILKARTVTDHMITLVDHPGGDRWAIVSSFRVPGLTYLIQNWDKDKSSCTCGYSSSGHACKHQVPPPRPSYCTKFMFPNCSCSHPSLPPPVYFIPT